MRTRQITIRSLGIILLLCGISCLCGPRCLAGTNPSIADIRALLIAAGQRHHIPPMILFGVAFAESGWQQFNADGSPHTNPTDGGVGIMQITGATASRYDANLLANDIAYNIEAGAQVLEGKWGATPVIGDGNGNVGREKLENWYYAVWAYNSWGYINNPNYINAAPPHTAHNPVYQDTVYGYIASCPTRLAGMWVGCSLPRPSNTDIGSVTVGGTVGCGQPIANTPSPYHVDADFDGVIDGTTGPSTDLYVNLNNTSAGDGSVGNPFKTINAAINAASPTASVTLHITSGWYHENVSTSKHILFVTNGTGTVRIGG